MNEQEYFKALNSIKKEIHSARNKAMISVNRELILTYYNIGKKINKYNKWGNNFIDTLARDLKISMPKLKGMSARNLRYMQKFASVYSEDEFLQQVVANLSWRSNVIMLNKLKSIEEIKWYSKKALENGWSSTVLEHQIGTKLIERQGNNESKITNYLQTLDKEKGERVQELFKDPYLFDFISYNEGMIEKDIEDILVNNITKLLMELGKGFAFVGRQYHLEVGGEDFFIDLLFYNIDLKCYTVIELKTDKFKPEYAGKLNFYLSAIDSILKKESDNPTIGILLCRNKNNIMAEFALRDIDKPVGVADYKYMQEIPKYLEKVLPEIEEIELRLNDLEK